MGTDIKNGRLPVPDRLIVLTFDDGTQSSLEFIAPMLKGLGFSATFFINRGDGAVGDVGYMSWAEIKQLHEQGFEIANHTYNHPNMAAIPDDRVRPEVILMEEGCESNGIPVPTTHAYPGGHHDRRCIDLLTERGYKFARRGTSPESHMADFGDRGRAYDPAIDHPLLIPSALGSGPNIELGDIKWAAEQARDGKITVLTFHGVPDPHPFCTTEPAEFRKYMDYLYEQKCTVIAFRDLAKYVDPAVRPSDPYLPIIRRLGIEAVDLKCDYAENPLGIDTAEPRFSWQVYSQRRALSQTAYRILASSNEENLGKNVGDLWDSGRVDSDSTVSIAYEGTALTSGQKCWWKVRCWSKGGYDGHNATAEYYNAEIFKALSGELEGSYSAPATFEMGLLEPSDWQGQWIGADPSISSPLLRKNVAIGKEIASARVYVSGLGYYELSINGSKVSDHVLDPAPTNYTNDTSYSVRERVLYVTHDVTNLLRTGDNAIGVMLGNGWYSADAKPKVREPYGDRPILLLQMNIELVDGERVRVATDESWRISSGPIAANDIVNGEVYDARLEKNGWNAPEFDDTGWNVAKLVDSPGGALRAQMLEPAKIMKTIAPVDSSPGPEVKNSHIYDFGRHFSGWARISVSGPRGTSVELQYSGALSPDGSLDLSNNLDADQKDIFSLKGVGVECWEPHFTLHGFRYVGITLGNAEAVLGSVEGRFVRSAVASSGSFTCSNELINKIHSNVCWTFMSSFQGIPQDAAERYERYGWLGDTGFVCEDYLYTFDTVRFWRKWLRDIADSQKPDGDIPVVAPTQIRDIWRPWPDWKSTYPILVWNMYQYYGDTDVLEEHYTGVERLVANFTSRAEERIMREGLGDHMEPQADGTSSFKPLHTPMPLTSTALYYRSAWILTRIAEVLGRTGDASRHKELADSIRNAYNKEFFDPGSMQYAGGSQTANAISLSLGLVPEGMERVVLENLTDDIVDKHDGHLSTGIIGTDALEQSLPKYGAADVMYTIATQTTFPSWGYQIAQGATTVWETWNGEDRHSLNMKMFGSTEKFFFKDLAGISPAAPGYRRVLIKPQVVGDLRQAEGEVKTVAGKVAVSWKLSEGLFELRAKIPTNCWARVCIPKLGLHPANVTECGCPVWQDGAFVRGQAGIDSAIEEDICVTFEVGSGYYVFRHSIDGIKPVPACGAGE